MIGRNIFYLGVVTALLTSCDRKAEIKVYRLSKAPLEETTPPPENAMPTNAASPAFPSGITSSASVGATTPTNWEPQPLSEMRQASFLVKGDNGTVADISLVSLGSSAGNVLDNVNRWLSQLAQPSISAEKLSEIAQQLTTSIGQVTIVDLAGLPNGADPAKDGRIIAAIAPTESATLFFKIRGNAPLTEKQKPEFIKWVAAVCNSQTENTSPQMAGEAQEPSAAAPQLKWKTPEGWTEVPASSMRYASFNASGENGAKIDISVVTFPGDGGSDADNVNRWRRQIGMAPVDENAVNAEVNPLKTADASFSTTDITGSEARTIAAWTRRDGRVWFFKMTGPSSAVEKEKSKFFDFVRSIQFNS